MSSDNVSGQPRRLLKMSWDPITRIVGSLGIHTTIDFANRQVLECHSTSSIFRGYSVFLRGKDPRDAHCHHESDLWDLWRQPRHLRCLRPEHGVRYPAAGVSGVDHQPR
jgi:hypothetical protein